MNDFTKNMNPEQKSAILINDSNLRIIAGAGAGKTRVITHKIAYLIEKMNVPDYKILAMTFTNKAANEMKSRVEKLLDNKQISTRISTFHALCAFILRQEIEVLDYPKDFTILDSKDQSSVIRPLYKKYDVNPKDLSVRDVLEYISYHKNNLTSIEELSVNRENYLSEIRYKMFVDYTSFLKKTKSLDFDDLLLFVHSIFTNFPEVRTKWENKYQYILVDEFQDTSQMQYDIIKALSKKAFLTIVGDPDQTIYSWRGADINLILDFDKDFTNVKTITLDTNYRSAKNILYLANSLIKKNKNRLEKTLKYSIENEEKVEIGSFYNPDIEARWVVDNIKMLLEKGTKHNNIAIFFRSSFYSRNIENALIYANIPYKIFGGERFYERKEIKDLIAFLRIINDGNEIAFRRVINVPARGIGLISEEKIYKYSESIGLLSFDLIKDRELLDNVNISSKNKDNLHNFANTITKYHMQLGQIKINDILKNLLDDLNYFEQFKTEEFINVSREDNVEEFLSSVKSWELKNPDKTLSNFLEEITLNADNGDTDENNYVFLMSIHSAKGLEFDYVFVIGLTEDIFPSKKAIEFDTYEHKLEEERRLAYVAITRAKIKLFLSNGGGNSFDNFKKMRMPSLFFEDMNIDILSKDEKKLFSKLDKYHDLMDFDKKDNKTLENYLTNNNDFVIGDILNHEIFGEGTIVDIDKDIIEVQFKDRKGTKKLMKNHKTITKSVKSKSIN